MPSPDGDPDHMFVAVLARIGEGRDAATRRRVAEDLMRVLEAETEAVFRTHGLGLTVRGPGDRRNRLSQDQQPARARDARLTEAA